MIFQTRWAMSYLRGPLTRSQVRQLMADVQAEVPVPAATTVRPAVRRQVGPAEAPSPTVTEALAGYTSIPPTLPPDLPQVFLPLRSTPNRAIARLEEELGQRVEAEKTSLVYEPCLLALGRVKLVDRRVRVSESKQVGLLIPPGDVGTVIRWEDADDVDVDPNDLERQPEPEASFGPVPSELNTASKIKAFGKDFSDYLYREEGLDLYYNPTLKCYSQPGESERDFKIRAQQMAREKRDAEVEKLRQKYQSKLDRLETRLAREEQELKEDQAEYEARKREELISAGESVIGMLGIFGRRSSSAVSKAARKRRMTTTARADIEESEEEIARLQAEIEELRQEMQEEATAITEKWAATLDEIESYTVKPRRSDVQVELVTLAWTPYWEIGHRSARGDQIYDRVPGWG